MNRLFWLILNLSLVLAACGIALLLSEDDPAERWSALKAQELAAAELPSTNPAPERDALPPVAAPSRNALDSKTLETLWRRSLFRPERTEDIEVKAEADKAAEEPLRKVEFELVATGMIKDRWVAVLEVNQGPVSRPPPTPNRGGVGRPPTGRLSTPKEPAKPPRTRHVYKVGDAVEETGYTVIEIHKSDVLLRKGEEDLVVSLETADETSQARRDAAVQAEATAAAQAETQPPNAPNVPNATVLSPSTPPPPPPMPGIAVPAGAGTATKGETLDERLQRMRDERNRLLRDKLKTPETTN